MRWPLFMQLGALTREATPFFHSRTPFGPGRALTPPPRTSFPVVVTPAKRTAQLDPGTTKTEERFLRERQTCVKITQTKPFY